KVSIIDDEFLRIGSSNLTNRSMSLDTECDLAFDAGTDEARAAVVAFRNRLLAEHLAVQPDTVDAAIEATGSIARAIAQLRQGDRTLVPYAPCTSELADSILPDGTIVDPGQPLTMERIAKWLFRREEFAASPSGPDGATRDDPGSADHADPRSPRKIA
ncbi:MAG TPA: hypothetical protein VFG69_05135, partial [Nannocystaceae bacterium]|nr:hypothetical protein [Nannocystaceae bacterium]